MKKSKIFAWGMLLGILAFGSNESSAQTLWQKLRTSEQATKPVSDAASDFKPSVYCIENQLNSVLDSLASNNLKATKISGFRILLYSGNARQEASKAKENAYRVLPRGNVYTSYQQPTFKVRLGDFYDKIEAFIALKKLEGTFPKAVLVSEVVNLK